MSEETVVDDSLAISSESPPFTNEIWNDTPENSPSFTEEQEVNKPLVNNLSIQPDSPSIFDELQAAQNNLESENVNECDLKDANSSAIANGESNGHIKKPKRKVTFPQDSEIVMGFLEPPDPWKNQPDWRTEDLLRAYKQSCERHGTKPLSKVLQQLQCIENVGERYEILSLKGERLDLKHIESLEEIFRHVRFRCIDVEATHLDDEMAVAIFEMVEYYESACKLNISFNKNIGPRGWQSCSRLVRKTPCLTFIDARNCDVNERVLPFLGRALRMGCYLTKLHLQNANIAGRALIILVAALKMNETLKELSIGDNKFMPTDGVHIGNLLKYNHKLQLLDLRNNHLQDAGTTHIADGLAEQCLDGGLQTLVLWNNQITFQAMHAINKALGTCEYIETLNLGHNPITNEGIHILKDGLLKSKCLLKLGLSGTKVTCEGAVALAEVIADNNRLVRVDLQENEIKTAGLMALSLALKVNDSLTRLDIDRETKKETGVKDYVEQQRRLQQDISSVLDRNRDLARQRDEEKRQIELKNEENERKLQEAAKDEDQTQEEVDESTQYIPSGDAVHRPKLLFLPQTSSVQNLDSPAIGSEIFESPEALLNNPTLPLPVEGPDLLSPQYCPNPKVTAKKIFSVTQVVSPTLPSPAVGDYLHSIVKPEMCEIADASCSVQVPQLCTPLSSLDLPNNSMREDILTPNTLQKVVGEHTIKSYIKDIIGHDHDNHTDLANNASNDLHDTNTEISENSTFTDSGNDLLDIRNDKKQIMVELVQKMNNECSAQGQCNDHDKSDLDYDSKEPLCETIRNTSDNIENQNVVKTVERESVSQSNENVSNVQNMEDCGSAKSNIPDKQLSTEIPNEDKSIEECNVNDNAIKCDTNMSVNSSEADSEIKQVEENMSVSSDHPSHLDELEIPNCDSNQDTDLSEDCVNSKLDLVSDVDNEVNSLSFEKVDNWNVEDVKDSVVLSEDKITNSAIKKEIPNTLNSEQKRDSNRNSADLESWSDVSKSELSENDGVVLVSRTDSDNNGNTNKPDFFSSLTMNGLKQELASLIDDEGNSSTPSGLVVNGNHISLEQPTGMKDQEKSSEA